VTARVAVAVTGGGVLAGEGGPGVVEGGEIWSTKARYCSMVSLGGVDTGKSNIQEERRRKERDFKINSKIKF